MDGFAAASFLTGIVGLVPLAAVFGVVGLRRVSRSGRPGKALAVTGLVLCSLWLVAAIVGVEVVRSHLSVRTGAGVIARAGSVGPRSLQLGDCAELPNPLPATVTSVDVVPCGQLHNSEMFFDGDLPQAADSGGSSLQTVALGSCREQLTSFIGTAASALHVVSFFPTQLEWVSGDRHFVCLAVDRQSDVTGSLRGTGI